jgi:hypothetical protein
MISITCDFDTRLVAHAPVTQEITKRCPVNTLSARQPDRSLQPSISPKTENATEWPIDKVQYL